MRLIWISNEAPFPAIHGGRVDVWRRLCALHAAGAEVFLLFWTGDAAHEIPDDPALSQLQQQANSIQYFAIRRTARERITRLMRLCRLPSHAGSRVLTRRQYGRLLPELEHFHADAVWLDGIYGGVLARRLADELKVPLFCRSHNIEHLYMKEQIAKATSRRDRLAWQLNIPHLRRFEHQTLASSCRFFDISSDDLQYWKDRGLQNGEWLPPVVDAGFADSAGRIPWTPSFDVGFVGNLYTPNNVDGLAWFIEQVVPELRSRKPAIRIFAAGSSPAARVITLARASGITLVPDPPDALPWFRNAKVLVNPIRAGSGVNIKSVEMLFSRAALVSTSLGLAGLPAQIRDCFAIAETPRNFAAAIDQALGGEPSAEQMERRVKARGYFSAENATELLEHLAAETRQWRAEHKGRP